MPIAASKRRRRQAKMRNRHLAPLRRPGLPKKMSAEKSAKREARKIINARKIGQKKKKD